MITFVTGMGRCGLSLIMQMLHAAGRPTVGRYPYYDVLPIRSVHWSEFISKREPPRDWIYKLPDPTLTRLQWQASPLEARAIFVQRNKTEQATSILRKAAFTQAGLGDTPDNVEKIRRSLIADEPKAIEYVRAVCKERILYVGFEKLLEQQRETAGRLCEFMQLDYEQAHRPMFAVMKTRDTRALKTPLDFRAPAERGKIIVPGA